MLLKISDGDGGWVLFDNVEQVHFTSSLTKSTSLKEIQSSIGDGGIVLVSKDCFKETEAVNIGVVKFFSHSVPKTVYFTGFVFVLGPTGDTIDKFGVNNNQKGRK